MRCWIPGVLRDCCGQVLRISPACLPLSDPALPINHGALSSNFLIASGATGPIMMCIEPVDTRFVGSVMGITRLGARWTSD